MSTARLAPLAFLLASILPSVAAAQAAPIALAVTRTNPGALRQIDQQIDLMIRSRELRVRETVQDTMLPDRRHERIDQYYRGVRIDGGDLTRQMAADGTVSVFGLLHAGIDLDPAARLSVADARSAIGRAVGGPPADGDPELVVLPLSDGYHLAYSGRASDGVEVFAVSVDANDGSVLRRYSEFRSEIIAGVGTYGDAKKVSVTSSSGVMIADDKLRPTEITTYDMKGNLARTTALFGNVVPPALSDVASTSASTWNDGIVVDAHVYAGWYYDYLFKRFGRHGIDDRDLRVALFTHPVQLADIRSAPPNVVGLYYINAAFCGSCGPGGRGAVVFGEGAPRGFFAPNVEVKPFSAALDVVAHELTHAVTASTARLNGFTVSEAAALNEAFSDIFGVSTAFFHLPPGTAPMNAGYVQGRDLTAPPGVLARSMAVPSQTSDPDHYTQRLIGGDPHYNGVIVTHAFYLAIEGGTNRTSGRTVQGVGAANREQIEKSFFRALTVLMPSNSTFALVRVATLQAARDLYGAGSSAERAITQAWDAVGVQERSAPTAAMLSTLGSTTPCTSGGATPSWQLGITVSAGSSTLQVGSWSADYFDADGRSIGRDVFSSASFAQQFNVCGPGSSRVLAQTDACAILCVSLGGVARAQAQLNFTATDAAGQVLSFTTFRVPLTTRP